MNKTSRTHDFELRPGMKIHGKWHKRSYLIKKKLGNGAIGTVYLCEESKKLFALKISSKNSSMTMEVNVLKSLEKVQGNRLGPYLIDVDDWLAPNGSTYSFYVMEYIDGQTIHDFISRNGKEWIGVFILQLLDDLEKLHQAGWVFGDLKTDNLIVSSNPPKIRWIDVGGTTQIGRAIKEYTEFYDRGYWELGSRRAEPTYDLFALVMIFLNLFYPSRFEKGANTKASLFKRIDKVQALRPYEVCFKKALTGKYRSAKEMRQEIAQRLYNTQRKVAHNQKTPSDNYPPILFESIGITLIAFIYYVTSLLVY